MRIHFLRIAHCPHIGTAVLLGLNRMFSVLVGGAPGHVAILTTRPSGGSLVSRQLVDRACEEVRLSQRWKGPGSPLASKLHAASRTALGQGWRDTTSFPSVHTVSFFFYSPLVTKSKAKPSASAPQPSDSSFQAASNNILCSKPFFKICELWWCCQIKDDIYHSVANLNETCYPFTAVNYTAT